MSTFRCCWPDHDPASWTLVEANDEKLAATAYVEQLCAHNTERYSAFGGGELVIVRGAGGSQAFEVTLEIVPHFSAREV